MLVDIAAAATRGRRTRPQLRAAVLVVGAQTMAAAASAAHAQEVCRPVAGAPRLDHVVVVASDLDGAAARFAGLGFRLKQGRLHANNLLNRHIKFRDGTSLELMTVRGDPGDAMAADYARKMQAGAGGVYVALTAGSLERVESAAARMRLEVRHSASGPWRFVSFPPASDGAAIFFSSGGAPPNDPDSLFAHGSRAEGLIEAWVEGGPGLGVLLEALGATRCGSDRAPDGRTGVRWLLASGALVIVSVADPMRPRVLGVVLSTREPRPPPVAYPLPEFWVRHRGGVTVPTGR